MPLSFSCSDLTIWRDSLSSYNSQLQSLNKPKLIPLDDFYQNQLPKSIHQRNPSPYITKSELSKLMQWKLTRGKWRPRLLDFVESLDDALVEMVSKKAFELVSDVEKAIKELTALKGVGPATASAVLAAFAPDVAPFMSDEAMVAALGNSKEYTLKQYLKYVEKLQSKSKELSEGDSIFTPSDIEKALWCSSIGSSKPIVSPAEPDSKDDSKKNSIKRKRKASGTV